MTAKLVMAAALVLVSAVAAAADLPVQPLEIDTVSGLHAFQVEVARTDPEREKGLMDRHAMARDHGMLFDFQQQQPVIFWMKDTYIPLDMIFVAADGRVVSIKHGAKPLDESLIRSGGPILGVVEVDAGVADAIGLKVGDKVKHPIFHDSPATSNTGR